MKQLEDSRSLRPHQPLKTAVQHTALAAHRVPPVPAAVQHNSRERKVEEQHRRAEVQRIVCWHQLFKAKRTSPVPFEKVRRDYSTDRLFLGKPLCVWMCVCTHSAWVSTAFWIFCSVLCSTCDKATNFTVLQPVLGVCGPLMWNLCQFGKMLLCLHDFFFP